FEQFLRSGEDPSLLAASNLYVGRAYVELGEPDRAEPYFRRVVERYPNAGVRPDAAARLGALYLDAGRPDEALALFRSLAQEADSPEAGAEARFGEARALLALGRAAEADTLFTAVTAAAPGSPLADRATLGLGRAQEALGRPDSALRLYDRLAADNDAETGPNALVQHRQTLTRRGDTARAFAAMSRLEVDTRFAGYPDQVAEALLLLARAYRADGETGRADETYQLIVDAYPETAAAAATRTER